MWTSAGAWVHRPFARFSGYIKKWLKWAIRTAIKGWFILMHIVYKYCYITFDIVQCLNIERSIFLQNTYIENLPQMGNWERYRWCIVFANVRCRLCLHRNISASQWIAMVLLLRPTFQYGEDLHKRVHLHLVCNISWTSLKRIVSTRRI